MRINLDVYGLLYTALICSAKNFALQPCLEGIFATFNSHIQALKLNQDKAGYSFKGFFLALSRGA